MARAEIERLLGAPIDDASLGSLLQPNVANVLKHNEAAVMVHDEGFSQKPEHTSQVVDPSCPSEIDHPSRRGNWRGAVGEITLFEKSSGILTKRISLGNDGQPVSDASECRMSKGRARRVQFANPSEFARIVAACTSSQALVAWPPQSWPTQRG